LDGSDEPSWNATLGQLVNHPLNMRIIGPVRRVALQLTIDPLDQFVRVR
jgi:hypothetical protein